MATKAAAGKMSAESVMAEAVASLS